MNNRNVLCRALLLIVAIQWGFVAADLPVHCLKSQVVGKWILKQGQVMSSALDRDQLACGHHSPDTQETSNLALGGVLAEVQGQIEVELTEDFQVKGKDGVGKWTLVYDEGWEINYQGTKYTHFFKYFKDGGSYKSDCSQTLVGWFNHVNMNQRGCSQAFKAEGAAKSVSDSIELSHVVQPKAELLQSHKSQSKPLNSIYAQKPHSSVFAQMSKVSEQDTLMNHQEIVSRLNKIEGKTWQAGVPKILAQMTLEKMNSHAGIRKSKPRFEYNSKSGAFIQTKSESSDFSHFSREDVSDLPRQHSWESKIHPARSQEDCGSCYSIATSAMLSSRLWISSGDKTVISPQHSLDCNFYNQGCGGGYGFLVSKYFSEFEAVPESCHPYTGRDGQCNTCDLDSLESQFIVTDYNYIGGSYGQSSERLMMLEILKNGPIVASFEPSMDFMYYTGGIYHSVEANAWISRNEKHPDWQRVDHSVLCYGWGEDEKGKYWLLQNSWGEDWGENGSFRMRRGTDESNIESMGEMALITKKSRKTPNRRSYVQTSSLKANVRRSH